MNERVHEPGRALASIAAVAVGLVLLLWLLNVAAHGLLLCFMGLVFPIDRFLRNVTGWLRRPADFRIEQSESDLLFGAVG